ncbi:Sad1 and UNC84 domain containing 1, transcript variant X9 [Ictidomys tridecemlineatus]|uniref:SUN domain-containing protein 1 isoform X15 n=1 Tax=Ictidomys tridecemlineatus TaxID=43179 RepID=UPI000B545B3D|nr:SUN domain-containing protein 1 isoform X15 [Ictidomys tridecemlineatus]KAG3260156.1 Sad1 and UNC84 domain containing 1, transcript variant X9 [Ictidomys tridecemlineatus]
MDFSRLHTYTPPQCVPENTGYTYALSSSYSSDALDFEIEHKLDPVFDSPRMSRRSLRLVTTTYSSGDGQAVDLHSCTSRAASLQSGAARTAKQRRSASKPAFSINHLSGKATSSGTSQGSSRNLRSTTAPRPPVLDESLIREQTKVDHFWGLDDDGDLKGGTKAATQGNGDLATDATTHNGYICRDCSMLSQRTEALTAHPASQGPSSRVYSRDRNPKRKAASGMLWWLGIGWYQFVTLISWLNVFLLTRCLRNICKFLILLIPLLLLLGAGISLWGQGDFLSLLPILNWTNVHSAHRTNDPKDMFRPGASYLNQPLQADDRASQWHQESDMGHQVASLTAQCHNHDQKLKELTVLLQKLQVRVNQMDDGREGLSSWVKDTVRLHLREMGLAGLPSTETNIVTFNHDHEVRLSNLEDILGKLRETSEAIQKELEHIKQRTISGAEEQPLLPRIQRLELELGLLRTQLSDWQHQKASCEEVDTQVRETIKLLFSEDQQGGSLEWLLQKFSSQFVSKDDLQVLLQDLELQVLKNITHHITVTGQAPTSEAVVSAMSNAGVSGITEEQVRVLVNKALKLYSQDKTGMVDFALESGGGSILSTRCSETYETKTALLSLFGIPLWYFSQSPRVVIQPDIYPGNCWAFKGSQGYLVVRLSMKIHPTIFTVEHIPKTLSPTGNISSAPKDFAVYGLENEYQEEGQPLGQFTYDQEGESLQMFHAPERPDKAFQILELRILSNWGHPEYTCLYRFRVHGEPAK